MHRNPLLLPAIGVLFIAGAWAQNAPIYHVNVIDRTVDAVNYQYRQGPTKIDFRGTVLLPRATGDATVESKAGRTEIDAAFKGLAPPTRFGREYLTYVLWAITPEGRARNLGEVLANGSDHAKLHVTTHLQAFGLIVTAEPYFAVPEPGDVVVMENQVRPDTIGKIEPIKAKYELLRRGEYTYTVPSNENAAAGNGPKLPLDQYQAVLEVYQAQSALALAQAAGADHYASDTYQRAEQLLDNARRLQSGKSASSLVVTSAREAAQTAEDARTIAVQRKQQDELAQAREQAAQAKTAADQARAEAAAERARLEAERDSAQRAEMERSAGTAEPAPAPAPAPAAAPAPSSTAAPATPPQAQNEESSQKKALRVRLLEELNGALEARDTPRGLVVTVADADFQGTVLSPSIDGNLARVASIVAAQPGLRVQVEGNCDRNDQGFSSARAAAVRQALVRGGLAPSEVTARGLGNSRPIVSNSSASGRERNRRVEIVVVGRPIGDLPYWGETYSVIPR